MITTKEVQKMISTDPKVKLDVKMKLDLVCIQEDADMGTADALRHIQQKVKVGGMAPCHLGRMHRPLISEPDWLLSLPPHWLDLLWVLLGDKS